jgi:hypothetical protein
VCLQNARALPIVATGGATTWLKGNRVQALAVPATVHGEVLRKRH